MVVTPDLEYTIWVSQGTQAFAKGKILEDFELVNNDKEANEDTLRTQDTNTKLIGGIGVINHVLR